MPSQYHKEGAMTAKVRPIPQESCVVPLSRVVFTPTSRRGHIG